MLLARQRIEPILVAFWPRKAEGRPSAAWRPILNGVVHRLRSGCQGAHLPAQFGPKSTIHDWFQRWNEHGLMQRIWAELVRDCQE